MAAHGYLDADAVQLSAQALREVPGNVRPVLEQAAGEDDGLNADGRGNVGGELGEPRETGQPGTVAEPTEGGTGRDRLDAPDAPARAGFRPTRSDVAESEGAIAKRTVGPVVDEHRTADPSAEAHAEKVAIGRGDASSVLADRRAQRVVLDDDGRCTEVSLEGSADLHALPSGTVGPNNDGAIGADGTRERAADNGRRSKREGSAKMTGYGVERGVWVVGDTTPAKRNAVARGEPLGGTDVDGDGTGGLTHSCPGRWSDSLNSIDIV